MEKGFLEVYVLVFDLKLKDLEVRAGARNASMGGDRISHADGVLLDGPHRLSRAANNLSWTITTTSFTRLSYPAIRVKPWTHLLSYIYNLLINQDIFRQFRPTNSFPPLRLLFLPTLANTTQAHVHNHAQH